MRRILCVLMVILIISLTLVACNKSTDDGKITENTEAENDKEPVDITIWTGSEWSNTDAQKRKMELFNKKFPWININFVIHDGDRVNDFIVASAVGNAPDMAAISFPMLGRMAASKLISPLDEFWDKWEGKDAINPELVKFCRINDKMYGFPIDRYLTGLVYNKKLFKEAGIEHSPTTWEELLDTSKKLSDSTKQRTGFGLLLAQSADWWFEYFVWQAGGDLTKQNPDGTVTCTFTDSAVIKAAEFYRTLRRENVIQSDYTKGYEDLKKEFAAGRMGMILGTIGATGDYERLGMKTEDIGYALLPKGPAGLNPSQFGGGMYGVNATASKEKQRAVFLYASFDATKERTIEIMKTQEEQGKTSIYLPLRTDVDMLQYRPSLVGQKYVLDLLKSAGNNLHLEYYGKSSLSDHINTAIQRIVLDDNSDIFTELKKAQDSAERQGAAAFNKVIKGEK